MQKYKLKDKNDKNDRINEILSYNTSPIIKFISTGLTYNYSLILEQEIILKIGRQKVNNGPLTNITSGGQGVSGIKRTKETTNKIKNTCIKNGHYERLSKNMIGNKNQMAGDKWHRTLDGEKSFNEKMKGKYTLNNKTNEEKTKIYNKIRDTLKGYKWEDTEKQKRSNGMKKVWENRKSNNKKINKNEVVKIINTITNEEKIFSTKQDAADYLNISKTTLYKRYTDNKIVNNIKIKFE
jgi:hypothetical protein